MIIEVIHIRLRMENDSRVLICSNYIKVCRMNIFKLQDCYNTKTFWHREGNGPELLTFTISILSDSETYSFNLVAIHSSFYRLKKVLATVRPQR